jgi:hypothetical protein
VAKRKKKVKNILKNSLLTLVITLGLAVSVYLSLQKTTFWGKAFGTPANLIIDAGSSFSVTETTNWANLAQGGEETGVRMILPVVEKVRALSPNYVRIDHIYDYYDLVGRSPDGSLSYNWTKLDQTVGDILLTGAKPFFALSYMPPAISSGDIIEVPRSWADWENLVKATVEHYSGTAGLGITDVYYEVWNEPDLFGKFKMGSGKNYLDLYYHSAIGVSRAQGVKPFKFGGPATTGLYKNWVDGLMKFCVLNSLRLDFISWHKYSKDLGSYERDFVDAKTWVGNFPQYKDIELIISETGPNSENDKVYDGNFAAIHAIAISTLLEGDVSKLFHFEIKDGPGQEKYWGRWGMFTHEKWGVPEAKPRYSALLFMNQMKGTKVNVAGEGSWVKAFAKEDVTGTIRVLVVNYDPSGKHTETVPITFNNLPENSFYVRRVDYGGVSENKVQITVMGNTWSTAESMKPNSAMILEISSI